VIVGIVRGFSPQDSSPPAFLAGGEAGRGGYLINKPPLPRPLLQFLEERGQSEICSTMPLWVGRDVLSKICE